jgi:hypothetical protein
LGGQWLAAAAARAGNPVGRHQAAARIPLQEQLGKAQEFDRQHRSAKPDARSLQCLNHPLHERRIPAMPSAEEKRPVTVVSAVMTAAGLPAFALTEVEVTPEQYDNAIHLYLAEAELFEAGYEEPFVHFAGPEAPPFLVPVVRQHLGLDAPVAAAPPAR